MNTSRAIGLRVQILVVGLAGAAAAAGLGLLGMGSTWQLGQALGDSTRSALALQASQRADMMHDAIRGDVQRAALAVLKQTPAELDDSGKDLDEHAKTYGEALDELDSLPITEATRGHLREVRPLVQRYTASAHEVLGQGRAALANGAPQAMDAPLARVQADFAALEKAMAAMSESVAQHSSGVAEQAAGQAERMPWVVAAVLAVVTAALVGLSLWLARRISAPIQQAAQAADRLAEGDLATPIAVQGNAEARRLLLAMARMQGQLHAMVGTVKSGADQVASASAQFDQGHQDLAERSQRQAGALGSAGDTVQRLGDAVQRNAEDAEQANRLAQAASQVAARGGEVMASVVHTMDGIHDSAQRIASIIGTIDGIAFQTNILALNAAVEAARAGEQGRGFAVVASEVRSLAQRSAEAAREVKALVGASVERATEGSSQVGEAGRTMQEIVSSIGRVTALMADISQSSLQQADGVRGVVNQIGQLRDSTQDNTTLVEEGAAAVASLRRQAETLVNEVANFKT